jgi:hypothetical protein
MRTTRLLARRVGGVLALAVALVAQPALATKFAGTNNSSGQLLYITPPKGTFTMFTTGSKPAGVVVGPTQEIIYVLSGTGQVHIFNPYTDSDMMLAKGFTTPVDVVLEPGCKTILVSDIGVNEIFRVSLSNGAVTTLYSGPDQMQGLAYDSVGSLFANDENLNAIVQLDTVLGTILNQTSSTSPLNTLEGLVYDNFSQELFASSNSGQVIYEVTTDLSTIASISVTEEPTLLGITSDGSGNIYVVGSNGTTNEIIEYSEQSSTQTILNTIPGLEAIWPIPFGPCIKALGGGDPACE